jgi:hypothetical protein
VFVLMLLMLERWKGGPGVLFEYCVSRMFPLGGPGVKVALVLKFVLPKVLMEALGF